MEHCSHKFWTLSILQSQLKLYALKDLLHASSRAYLVRGIIQVLMCTTYAARYIQCPTKQSVRHHLIMHQ